MNSSTRIVLSVLACFASLVACDGKAEDCPTDKYVLWSGKYLHGVNIFQGKNPAGATNGIGDGDFSQSDFDSLRQAGANYVQLSHAGILAEVSPYSIDSVAEASLDMSIQRAMSAGLYVVIAFRSGPGRNENAITNREGMLREEIWTVDAARAAWVQMLRRTAGRYRDNPAVVGYSIMVEPNSYARHGFPSPSDFYAKYAGSLQDVNRLYALATTAIREVDSITPILLEPDGYSGIEWLPFIKITGDSRTVYTVHDYTPYDFTHESVAGAAYPGRYDLDSDGALELVDRSFIASILAAVSQFAQLNSVPVAITEFGVHRTASNAATYLNDRISIQNSVGSWAAWTWQPAGFDDPFNLQDRSTVHTALVNAWSGNCAPTFQQPTISSGMLLGRSLSTGRKAIKGVKLKAGTDTATSDSGGRYALTLPQGSYSVSASGKGLSCVVGSLRGPKRRTVTISADQNTPLNVYCSGKG